MRQALQSVVVVLLPSIASAETFTGKVINVSDGDSITVLRNNKPERIELHAVDCADTKQPYGQRAKQLTSKMVLGKQVRVEVVTRGYGRTIARVYVSMIAPSVKQDARRRMIKTKDGWVDAPSSGQTVKSERVRVCLNEELVRAGLAWWYKHGPKNEKLAKLQAEAKKAKRGLWAYKDAIAPWDQPKRRRASLSNIDVGRIPSRRHYRVSGVVVKKAFPPKLPWSKDRICKINSDCAFLPRVCPGCSPCSPTWRRPGNRKALQKIRVAKTKARCRVHRCAPCSNPNNHLGDEAVCIKGQCTTRQAPSSANRPLRCNVYSKVCHRPSCSNYRCRSCQALYATEAAAKKAGHRLHNECANAR